MERWFPVVFPAVFVGMWCLVSSLLRARSGFSWATSRSYRGAAVLGSARWCGARIHDVAFSGCLHIDRLEGGFLLRISRIFLGGSRFVSDADLAGYSRTTSWFGGERITVTIGADQVVLFGKAARFVLRYAAPPP
jgi:hypothetical protein